MLNFHEKPIFDQYDEDMDACYTLGKQKEDPRYTFERNFTPLEYSYDDILQTLLGPLSSSHYLNLAHMETHSWISIVLIINIMSIVLQIALC